MVRSRAPGSASVSSYALVTGEEVFLGVEAFALPWHTTGHTGYAITSGARPLAFGDALTTPLQIRQPV